jgi:hypothetical protein
MRKLNEMSVGDGVIATDTKGRMELGGARHP